MVYKDLFLEKLFEAGAHIGHKTRYWHPRMKSYIYAKHNGLHVINLEKTICQFRLAIKELKDIISKQGKILFIGTKHVVSQYIALTANKCNQYYINSRWLGGTLTNWNTIKKLIEELKILEKKFQNGDFENLNKKEYTFFKKKMYKLKSYINGIKEMEKIPDAIFFIDAKKESIAIKEALQLNIKILGIVDTDSNPENIDVVIPANDDSRKAIKLYLSILEESLLTYE